MGARDMGTKAPAAFIVPAEVADYCAKAAEVLRSSEHMLRRNLEIWNDPDDPDWHLTLPHAEAATCADNLAAAAGFFAWLGDATPTDGGADV